MKFNQLGKAVCSILLASVTMFGLFDFISTKNDIAVAQSSSDFIWSALATEKIRQDVEYTAEEKGPAEVNISMCRNETEGANLILSPSKDIKNYELIVSNLSDGNGNVIAKEDIKIYHQHYIRTYESSNAYFKPGWYPDALIPFENAKNKGENNIKAGNNQGIYISVETHETTVGGNYYGDFTLVTDGVSYKIPVNICVYDFAVPEGEWPKTIQTMWLNYLTQGEYESTTEMWEAYNEFFLDYGISCLEIPIDGLDIDSFLQRLKKNYDRMTAYNIPYISGYNWEASDRTNSYGVRYDELGVFVRNLIKFSVEENKDYLSKAYVYNFYIDEYDATGTFGQTRIDTARYFADGCFREFSNAIAYFDNLYGSQYIDSVEGLRESIMDIGLLSVCGSFVDGVTDKYNALVISYRGYYRLKNQFGDTFVQDFKDDENNRNTETWWYTTLSSVYPNVPGYFIDDPATDERIMSWMQYSFGLEGHLYWANNNYSGTLSYGLSPDDEWTMANRAGGGATYNGDGYLVYPGYEYGIKGPIGTVRLENIRDGMEEYKWLKLVDQEAERLSNYYGEKIDSDIVLESIFNSLWNGQAVNYDDKNFAYQRNSLAQTILSMQGDEKLAILTAAENNNEYVIEVVADKDYKLTSDCIVGTPRYTSNGNGKIYKFVISKDQKGAISLEFSYNDGINNGTFERLLGYGSEEVVSFNSSSDANNVLISSKAGSEIVGVSDIDGRTGLNIKLSTYTGVQALVKSAYFEFETDYLLSLMENPSEIYIDIYNNSDYNLPIVVYGTSTRVDEVLASTVLNAKEWTRVSISNLKNIENFDTIRVSLPNTVKVLDFITEVEIPIDMHDIYLSRLAYVSK